MLHRHITNSIDAYLDNELDEKTALEIKNHLESCSECREEYELALKLKESLKASVPPVDITRCCLKLAPVQKSTLSQSQRNQSARYLLTATRRGFYSVGNPMTVSALSVKDLHPDSLGGSMRDA